MSQNQPTNQCRLCSTNTSWHHNKPINHHTPISSQYVASFIIFLVRLPNSRQFFWIVAGIEHFPAKLLSGNIIPIILEPNIFIPYTVECDHQITANNYYQRLNDPAKTPQFSYKVPEEQAHLTFWGDMGVFLSSLPSFFLMGPSFLSSFRGCLVGENFWSKCHVNSLTRCREGFSDTN